MTRGNMMAAIDTQQERAGAGRARQLLAGRMLTGAVLAIGGVVLMVNQGLAQNNGNQVIAKIGSTEITRAMLRQEMPGGTDNPAIERQVLQSIIARKLLADEARRQGLDRTPVGAMVLKRADEVTAVGMLEKKYAGTPQQVSDAQVRDFIAAHPLMFAQRHLIALDQFIARDVSKTTIKSLEAANSMSDFSDVLLRDRVSYQPNATVVDTLNIPPALAGKLIAFKPGQVFITPGPDGSAALSGVTSNTLAPIDGASAERIARVILQRSQVMQKVQAASAAVIKAGQDKVKINPQFAPKKT